MSPSMNVDPEALIASGAVLDAESQRIRADQSRCDTAVESALPGWIGQSRAAMGTAAAQWTAATAALAGRLYEHGEALRVSGLSFAEMDAGHARTLNLRD